MGLLLILAIPGLSGSPVLPRGPDPAPALELRPAAYFGGMFVQCSRARAPGRRRSPRRHCRAGRPETAFRRRRRRPASACSRRPWSRSGTSGSRCARPAPADIPATPPSRASSRDHSRHRAKRSTRIREPGSCSGPSRPWPSGVVVSDDERASVLLERSVRFRRGRLRTSAARSPKRDATSASPAPRHRLTPRMPPRGAARAPSCARRRFRSRARERRRGRRTRDRATPGRNSAACCEDEAPRAHVPRLLLDPDRPGRVG